MKGLLIKDARLLLSRKRSFLIVFGCGLLMSFSADPVFVTGWLVLIGSLFSLSTIAYDEHDNCFPFLMTLPPTRKCYAVEKYVFGLILDGTCWVAAVALGLLVRAAAGAFGLSAAGLFTGDGAGPLFVMLLLPVLLLDVSIPLNLKFGSEKGRIYMFVLWGVLFAGAYLLLGRAGSPDIAPSALLSGRAVALAAAGLAALTAGSVIMSIRIMEKKEF